MIRVFCPAEMLMFREFYFHHRRCCCCSRPEAAAAAGGSRSGGGKLGLLINKLHTFLTASAEQGGDHGLPGHWSGERLVPALIDTGALWEELGRGRGLGLGLAPLVRVALPRDLKCFSVMTPAVCLCSFSSQVRWPKSSSSSSKP